MKDPKKAVYLKEIEIKYKIKKVKSDKIIDNQVTGPEIVVRLFRDLQNETKEKFITINLDAKNKIRCFEVVAIGSLAGISIRPFEVFRTSVMVNAYGVILVHNHPSGDPEPSPEDKNLTEELIDLSNRMGLPLYDHIIIGLNSYFSFAEQGLLKTQVRGKP